MDGGVRVADPSTVVDMTIAPPKILRQGKVISNYPFQFCKYALHFDLLPHLLLCDNVSKTMVNICFSP